MGRVIGHREGNLYLLRGQPVQALVHDNDNLCELWNRRMGHLHYTYLPLLWEMVTSLLEFTVEHDGVCKACAFAKYAKATFPSSETRFKGALDFILSNVCGPMLVEFVIGYCYYVTFIDDFSRRTWIYFLKAKNEVFSRFQKFKNLL